MAYPLPTKPYDTEDFDYFLVAVPRGIGFHRAVFGHYSDLGSVRFWGAEGYVKPDSDDAAQRMRQAIVKTMEIYAMGWLENMYGAVDGLEGLIQQLIDAQCCSQAFSGSQPYEIVGTDPYPPEDTTVGGGALPPAFLTNPLADYDSSGTIGWDDYAVYLCDAAYRVVAGIESAMSVMRYATSGSLFASVREMIYAVVSLVVPEPLDSALDWITLAYDEMYELVFAVGNWLTGAPTPAQWDAIFAEWESTVKQQVLCHIANAVSADTAAVDVRADVQSLYGTSDWDGVWALYPFQRILRKSFEGAEAYQGPIQDCTCLPTYDYTLEYDCCTRDRWSYWNHDASGCRFWVPAGGFTDLGLLGDDLELEIEDYVGAAITAATVERVTVTVNELTAGHFSSNPISCNIVRGAGDTYTEQLVAGENVIINGNPNGTEAYIGNVYVTVQFPTTGNFEITEIKIEGDVTLA